MDPVADDAIDHRLHDLARKHFEVTTVGRHSCTVHALVVLVHLTCRQFTVHLKLVRMEVLRVSVLIVAHLFSQIQIQESPLSQVLERRRALVRHGILIDVVMKLFPLWEATFVRSIHIHVVSVLVCGDHQLTVEIQNHE